MGDGGGYRNCYIMHSSLLQLLLFKLFGWFCFVFVVFCFVFVFVVCRYIKTIIIKNNNNYNGS